MNEQLTILPLARAIRTARARGVTNAQIRTIAAAVELGGLDTIIDAFDEAEQIAAKSGMPIRTVLAMAMRSKRQSRSTLAMLPGIPTLIN